MDAAASLMGNIWFGVLVFALIVFGGTVAICSVRGLGDIVSLFKTLNEEDEEEELDKFEEI